MVGGIEFVHRHSRLREDTGIGLLFVGMLALGVAIISKSRSYTGSLTSILFGDAFGASEPDLLCQAILAAIVVIAAVVLYRPLLVLTLSAQKAQTLGMRPRLVHALLLVLIAAAVIGSFQTVGTLLVFGQLVGPPATAALVARTVPRMFVWSIALSAFSVWLGLALSFHLGIAGSATMALVAVAVFFLVLTTKWLVESWQRRSISTRARRAR